MENLSNLQFTLRKEQQEAIDLILKNIEDDGIENIKFCGFLAFAKQSLIVGNSSGSLYEAIEIKIFAITII